MRVQDYFPEFEWPSSLDESDDPFLMNVESSPEYEVFRKLEEKLRNRPGGIDERTSRKLIGAAMIANGLRYDTIEGLSNKEAVMAYIRDTGDSPTNFPWDLILKAFKEL